MCAQTISSFAARDARRCRQFDNNDRWRWLDVRLGRRRIRLEQPPRLVLELLLERGILRPGKQIVVGVWVFEDVTDAECLVASFLPVLHFIWPELCESVLFDLSVTRFWALPSDGDVFAERNATAFSPINIAHCGEFDK